MLSAKFKSLDFVTNNCMHQCVPTYFSEGDGFSYVPDTIYANCQQKIPWKALGKIKS